MQLRVWMAVLTLGVGGPVCAAFDLDRLQRLYEQEQFPAAYEYAVQNRASEEGDPYFDYYYGLAAIETGNVSEGVFALERVLFAFPDDDRARLELARGYFHLQEYRRSREEFEKVLEKDPPPEVQANIQSFLNAMRLEENRFRTTGGIYVEVAIGYDTNVNSATADANFVTPTLGSGTLSSASTEQEDFFGAVATGGQLSIPIRDNLAVFGRVDFKFRENVAKDDFETTSGLAELGLDYLGRTDRYRLAAQGQYFAVGSENFRNLLGYSLEWRRNLSKQAQINGFFQMSVLDYPDSEARNSTLTTIGMGATRRFNLTLSPVLYGSIYAGLENAHSNSVVAQSSAERFLGGVNLGAQLLLAPRLALNTTLSYQTSTYEVTNSIFQVDRKDSFYGISGNLTWLFSKNWSLKADASYFENDSSISINDYERASFALKLRYDYF